MIARELEMIKLFRTFIYSILSRPGMFQVNNVNDLGLVIFGYLAAINKMESGLILNDFMDNFRAFVNKYFESDFNYDWERLIRFHSSGDKGSLELFKTVFDKFIEDNRE